MNTYEFRVTVESSTFKTYTQSNNPSFAYQKARRLFPTASEIRFIGLVRQKVL